MLTTLLGILAGFETRMLVERIQAGIEAARAAGRVGGRPRVRSELRERQIAALLAARRLGVSRSATRCKRHRIGRGEV